jgi:hypothetical protein
MKRLFRICAIALPLAAFLAAPVAADVKTRDRSQIKFEGMLGRMVGMFGGKAAKEGVESSTAVKGNRKATMSDTTGRIVDLSEEKVYDLDVRKKTYTVTTFDELRQRMREAEEKAKKDAEKAEKEQPGERQQEKPEKEIEVDFDVKETGQKKQIAGYDTHESVVTITVREKGKTLEESGGLVMTSNIFLGPQIPQMKEVAEFELRYWKQLQGPDAAAMSAEQMAAVLAMYPMVKTAMERMQKEGSKLQGTPLETTTVFEGVKSKEQLTQAQQSSSSGGSGGIGGMLARKMMKKEEPKARATIFTMHNEVIEVATSVAAADLTIPADFKEKK